MKSIFISLVALGMGILGMGEAKAQDRPHIKTPEEKAEARTKIMTCELELTAEEIPKVYGVNLNTAHRLDSAIQKIGDHPSKINKVGTKLDKERDVAMRRAMTSDHYSLYLKIVDEYPDALKKTAHCREGDKKN